MLPTVHYNMGGIPTNYHGEVVTLTRRRPGRGGAGPDGGRRGGLRLGARRQPARLQLAARPRGVRPRRGATAAPRRSSRARRTSRCRPRPATTSLARLDRLRHANGGTPTAEIRDNMQRTMQNDAAVFRTGETLQRGRATRSARSMPVVRRRQGQRPLADLELRPGRDAGAGEPAGQARGDHRLGARTARRAAARTRARTSRTATTSNWMKHTLCWVDERRRDAHRLPAGAPARR